MADRDDGEILALVRDFVDREVRPQARDLEAADAYPEQLIEQMKQLGFFGLLVPEEYGGVAATTATFAAVSAELARGWMSLSGAIGGHSVICYLLHKFGTDAQRRRYLPALATGATRATMALTEPGGGSDLQAMRTRAEPQATGGYLLSGTKTWISNAAHAGLFGVLCRTDPGADPSHRGMSVLLVEPGPDVSVSDKLGKLGYRGVEACEVVFDDVAVPAEAVLGERSGEGWAQMMRGLEIGRIQVAARAVGVAQAALDDATSYAQQRTAFGRPIWQHQGVGNLLADMATKVQAARLLMIDAAAVVDEGRRADMEAGMAKLFASEIAMQVALDAMRVHGGAGYSTDLDIQRYFRDAPLMIIGEGTNEIQRNVIAAQWIARHPL